MENVRLLYYIREKLNKSSTEKRNFDLHGNARLIGTDPYLEQSRADIGACLNGRELGKDIDNNELSELLRSSKNKVLFDIWKHDCDIQIVSDIGNQIFNTIKELQDKKADNATLLELATFHLETDRLLYDYDGLITDINILLDNGNLYTSEFNDSLNAISTQMGKDGLASFTLRISDVGILYVKIDIWDDACDYYYSQLIQVNNRSILKYPEDLSKLIECILTKCNYSQFGDLILTTD